MNLTKKIECEEKGNQDTLKSIMANLKGNMISPVADCNSNNLQIPKENLLLCSTDSIQDCPDFLQDNSDYQWFLDYGYKESNYSHHQSILALSKSQDLVYYEDMSRNIDANLAEVDMDDFNSEDIHLVLSTLPNMQGVEEREMFASVSESMMVKFGFDESISPHNSSQDEPNTGSVCKSQPLFSPIHDNYIPNANLSVDSLDLSENDMNLMVTCQANKNNYTIAFEGSTVMGAEDSESRETGSTSEENEISRFESECCKNQEYNNCFAQQSSNTMIRSDSPYTTWSKIKKNSNENLELKRHPSGNNNNTTQNSSNSSCEINNSKTTKSLSLPNLCQKGQKSFSGLTMSAKLDSDLRSSSFSNQQKYIKLYDIQNSCNSKSMDHSALNTSNKAPHNFSLMKLFIKQKSGSHEGMSYYTTDDTSNSSNSTEQTDNDEVRANNLKMNKMNQIKNFHNCPVNIIKGNIFRNKDKKFQCELNNSPINQNEAEKINYTKISRSENQITKEDYNLGFDNKYCSDESTQENGSNTESAENLICHCAKASSKNDFKKNSTEKSIQTSSDTTNSRMKVPVYILYPNYSLPNLEFLKKEHYVQNVDFSKIFIRPQKYQAPTSQAFSPKNTKRPFSVNDIESLKKTGFKHVRDWESLTFLLPKEYKQFLQEIPEIVSQLKEVKNPNEELVPLFCLSPPPNRKLKRRPMSCELNMFSNDYRNSTFSSTATQPSSGYRGSSTMLYSNNSSSTSSPRNPSRGYKYDYNSDSGSSRRSSNSAHSKNYMRHLSETTPSRPPLPKGILRNNSLDNQQYTCKTQKENANKRYSMIELSEQSIAAEDKLVKTRSHNLNSQLQQNKNQQNNPEIYDYEAKGKGHAEERKLNEVEENFYANEQSKVQNDLRRLEELLEISAAFSENMESFTENDMIKLRSQVSRFLTMHKNLERVSETLLTVDDKAGQINVSEGNALGNQSLDVIRLNTPHNTPEHKKQVQPNDEEGISGGGNNLKNNSNIENKIEGYEYENTGEEDCYNFNNEVIGGMKKTVSFSERISFAVKERESLSDATPLNSPSSLVINQKLQQVKNRRSFNLPICEESSESLLADSPIKHTLQISEELIHKKDLILHVKNAVDKIIKISNETQEDPTNLCLHQLCPTLYAVLSDGLKDEIETPFGPIRNSVWGVVEASSQNGPMIQTLNELVQRLNRDDVFTEGLIKFNAFIFGLINARALSGWLSYLRTRDSLLRKYYDNSGLLLMSNTSATFRILVDQLINTLEPLSSIRFNLDLMYQTKLLHCSLQNLNHLLEEADNNAFLTPTKQFMLLKLVQSIQNSINQSGEGKKGKLMEEIEQKTSDPPLANLLEKNKSVRTRRGSVKARPRSGCGILGPGKEIPDVNVAMKKRWSGVHTNSKLVEAFEKLGNDSESDYTDSLDCKNIQREQEKSSSSKTSDSNTKEQKKNILLNLNKKAGRSDNCKTEVLPKEAAGNFTNPLVNGHKFKRLQQKWEKLSGRSDSDTDCKSISSEGRISDRPKSAPEKNQSERQCGGPNISTTPSPTSRISKIPRLVTSPSSTSPSIKAGRKALSPTTPSMSTTNQKTVKGNVQAKTQICEPKTGSTAFSHVNKSDEKSQTKLYCGADKSHLVRPNSLPFRGCNTMPSKKSEIAFKKASSMSLNRRTASNKLQHVQRTVRTLTHRLPSDSGHLSFNEGEKLKVVLEVDKTWLLCCRGSQKGLVPKSAVISDIEDNKF